MKAVVIHGPEQVSIDEVVVREPGAGEVLVKVMAAGLCGTDYELYTNDMVYIKEGLSRLPLIPGHEWSGVVVKAGPGVSSFQPGDKVSGECTVNCQKCWYCQRGIPNQCRNRTETGIMNRDGGFAEYITFPVSHLHRFKTLSFEEASLIEPTGIALYALQRGRITPFDNVVVMGPGPVGLQAAQIAKKVFRARKVILVGTRQERLDRAANFGLDGLVNIRQEDVAGKVRDYTDGRMADLVLEESGGSTVFSEIKKIISPCGRIVLNGFFGSRSAPIDWDFITVNDINIIGALGSPNIWDDVIDLLESGMIETKSLISHVLRLDEFEKGLDIMVNRRDNACKVILKP
jgi:2-desacetyl-2-hydroxyethyl bacteriochlorophyllide A dehydrogenase